MPCARFASLAVSALALVSLTAGGATVEAASLSTNNPSGPGAQLWVDPYWSAVEGALDTHQLFKFPALSNKSATNCMAGSLKDKGRPRVVATFPADGAVVRPGVVVVRVTFDQPMACDASFDGVSDLPNPCPGRWREATLSRDQRSFRTVCEVKANTRYRLTLRSFRNAHGLAMPQDATFSTSGAVPIATIQQALAEDIAFPTAAGG